MPVGGDPGPWGPMLQGGRRRRLLRRVAKVAGILSLVGVVAVASTGFELYRQLEGSLTRVPLDQLDDATSATRCGPSRSAVASAAPSA